MDTRLYSSAGMITRNLFEHYEIMQEATCTSSAAYGIEVLAGKVVKFLLTEKGSDAFNSSYGGTAMHHLQISNSFLPKLRLELLDDLDACAEYIRKGEDTLPSTDTSERLYALTLKNLVYDPQTPNRVDAYIEILSNTGKREVVTVTNYTDQND